MDRIVGIEYHCTTGLVSSIRYAYNDAGMITNRTTEDRGQTTVVSYAYNSVDELVREYSSVTHATGVVNSLWEYSYDLAGNRTNWVADGVTNVSAFASGNRMTGWGGGSSIGYDEAGNMTQIVNRAGVTNSLVWNARYQLTEVRTNGAIAESYGYDALGRRAVIATGSSTNYLIYDGYEVIAETDASGNLVKSYVWAPGIDRMLSYTTYGATTNTYCALTDHLGTIHAFAADSGAIVESYRYDAWGNVLGVYDGSGTPLNESAIGNRYLWQGREYSWATGLYYFRARWYDPITGRWLSKDPIGISGGLNQYEFCRSNAISHKDPNGLDAYIIVKDGHMGLLIDAGKGKYRSYDFSMSQRGNIIAEARRYSQGAEGKVISKILNAEDVKKNYVNSKEVAAIFRVKGTDDASMLAEAFRQAQPGNAPKYGENEGVCVQRAFELLEQGDNVVEFPSFEKETRSMLYSPKELIKAIEEHSKKGNNRIWIKRLK